MKKRLMLSIACWVVLSLCASPGVSLAPENKVGEYAAVAASRSIDAPVRLNPQSCLYIPPAKEYREYAPALLGSVEGVPTEIIVRPLHILTNEPDYIDVYEGGESDFGLWIQGTGEPSELIEIIRELDEKVLKRITIRQDSTWDIFIPGTELVQGEIAFVIRYVEKPQLENAIWRSYYAPNPPELSIFSYVPEKTQSITGLIDADAQLTAFVEDSPLPCLVHINGSFSVFGISELPIGTEITLLATNSSGVTTKALCMVAKQDAEILKQNIMAVQAIVHPSGGTIPRNVAYSRLEPMPVESLKWAGGDQVKTQPSGDFHTATSSLPDPTLQPTNTPFASSFSTRAPVFISTQPPIAYTLPEPTVFATSSPKPTSSLLMLASLEAIPKRKTPIQRANSGDSEENQTLFSPAPTGSLEMMDAYATIEGLTLSEIDAFFSEYVFASDVRMRLRDMRRQMVLPVDLSSIGPDGVELPLVARGYRVGSIWIDPAVEISADSGKERNGYIFTMVLDHGELMGRERLQVARTPWQLDAIKAQGLLPITEKDISFYDFDTFVPMDGTVLIYACVPVRFDSAKTDAYHRTKEDLAGYQSLFEFTFASSMAKK